MQFTTLAHTHTKHKTVVASLTNAAIAKQSRLEYAHKCTHHHTQMTKDGNAKQRITAGEKSARNEWSEKEMKKQLKSK